MPILSVCPKRAKPKEGATLTNGEEMHEEEPEEAELQIMLPPQQMAGVWANYVHVTQSPYEFTLDFVRVDFNLKQGIVAARVSMSPLLVTQLMDVLDNVWQQYAERAMPQEVRDAPPEDEGDAPGAAGA
jgi:Protein of unknown function (DUF3467)